MSQQLGYKEDALQVRVGSTPLKTAYDFETPTRRTKTQYYNQACYTFAFTPAAINTVLYVKVLFNESSYSNISTNPPTIISTAPKNAYQIALDFKDVVAPVNGVWTVEGDILEMFFAFNSTATQIFNLPVKCGSGWVALDLKADNPGASVLDIWCTVSRS